mmetsp:Transcript_19545/g.66468  ORF Transcript_19545/g.66468 Transcript_19545/m.66468 type:complete len:244 (-) Transcript_19545:470-1201(-)
MGCTGSSERRATDAEQQVITGGESVQGEVQTTGSAWGLSPSPGSKGGPAGPPQHSPVIATRKAGGAESARGAFMRMDRASAGKLTREDLFIGMQQLNLGLSAEMYRQYVDSNFVYADVDGDGRLSLSEYESIHKMVEDVRSRFREFDTDNDGLITKKDFTAIVLQLNLNLDPIMAKSYIDINFRYVDRNFTGKITFGQFLACYANFLQSHAALTKPSKKQNSSNNVLAFDDDLRGGDVNGPLR